MEKTEEKKIIDIMVDEFRSNWADNETFMKMLNITSRTALKYRDSRKVGYTKIFGKIWYKVSEIEKMMNKNYKPGLSKIKQL